MSPPTVSRCDLVGGIVWTRSKLRSVKVFYALECIRAVLSFTLFLPFGLLELLVTGTFNPFRFLDIALEKMAGKHPRDGSFLSVGESHFKVFDVKGDGNCFYRSVSQQVNGTEDDYQLVRFTLDDYVGSHREELETNGALIQDMKDAIEKELMNQISYPTGTTPLLDEYVAFLDTLHSEDRFNSDLLENCPDEELQRMLRDEFKMLRTSMARPEELSQFMQQKCATAGDTLACYREVILLRDDVWGGAPDVRLAAACYGRSVVEIQSMEGQVASSFSLVTPSGNSLNSQAFSPESRIVGYPPPTEGDPIPSANFLANPYRREQVWSYDSITEWRNLWNQLKQEGEISGNFPAPTRKKDIFEIPYRHHETGTEETVHYEREYDDYDEGEMKRALQNLIEVLNPIGVRNMDGVHWMAAFPQPISREDMEWLRAL